MYIYRTVLGIILPLYSMTTKYILWSLFLRLFTPISALLY